MVAISIIILNSPAIQYLIYVMYYNRNLTSNQLYHR
nr:MAG TPA: hypothetical protein [Caudoviricetes sp.]